jgi:hypothetical protein
MLSLVGVAEFLALGILIWEPLLWEEPYPLSQYIFLDSLDPTPVYN